jgi:hypothetical protein
MRILAVAFFPNHASLAVTVGYSHDALSVGDGRGRFI